MEITLPQIYALEQNALSDGIQPVPEGGWCGESECAAPASLLEHWDPGALGFFCPWGVEGAELGNTGRS